MGAVLSDCSVQRTSTRGVQRRRLATAETPANFAGANSKGPVRDAIATHGQGNRWAFKNIPDRSRDRRCFETFGDGKKGACRCPSNGQELIRVAIVDDDEYARFLLKRIVEESGQFQCVGSCASGDEALQAIPIARPKIVLMDIRMPGMSGIESMRQLRRVM